MAFEFTLTPMLEYIELDFEHDYLIDPILPKGGVGLIHGKGGHGKTQLTFTIAKAVADGTPLFGRYQCEQGGIALIQLDMTMSQFSERLGKLAPSIQNPELIEVFSYEKPINILDPEFADAIADKLAERRPSLVVFDTLRKLHPYDENDNAVPSQVYGAIREICAGATAIVLHHDRKAPTQNGAGGSEEAAESFRGARAWVDDCDLGLRLRKRKDRVMVDWSKLRCAEQADLLLRMHPDSLLLEPRDPETAREWAERLAVEYPDMERSELVKEAARRAGVSPEAVRKTLR